MYTLEIDDPIPSRSDPIVPHDPPPDDLPHLPVQCPSCGGAIFNEHKASRRCIDPRLVVIEFYCEFCARSWTIQWRFVQGVWRVNKSMPHAGEDAEIHRMLIADIVGVGV